MVGEMRLSSSDIYQAYQPTPCTLRLFLKHKGVKTADPGPFEEVRCRGWSQDAANFSRFLAAKSRLRAVREGMVAEGV
jgi:hypothetical protein